MVTTCFFCQNLLSDYIEGILPSIRHEELKKHLETCGSCKEVHTDLISTIDVLHELPKHQLASDLLLRINEASESGKGSAYKKRRLTKNAVLTATPLLIFLAMLLAFPQFFPWLSYLRSAEDSAQFVRYFPLLQGAGELLEEQSNWLQTREQASGSLWEEGGLSPDEFEKAFQKKGSAKDEEQ
jgi:hypothetical protein